jgi:hypothetical protein
MTLAPLARLRLWWHGLRTGHRPLVWTNGMSDVLVACRDCEMVFYQMEEKP